MGDLKSKRKVLFETGKDRYTPCGDCPRRVSMRGCINRSTEGFSLRVYVSHFTAFGYEARAGILLRARPVIAIQATLGEHVDGERGPSKMRRVETKRGVEGCVGR